MDRIEQEDICRRCVQDPSGPMCRCCPERDDRERGRGRGRGDLEESKKTRQMIKRLISRFNKFE